MTLTQDTTGTGAEARDLNTDLRRLIDAGYTVTFQQPLAGAYYAEIFSEFGSRWKCLGDTPAEAIRSNWPLGQGGCGHCGGLGCEKDGCKVCSAYTGEPGNGTCAVCGTGYPLDGDDEPEPYCRTCGGVIAIFHGMEGWHHYRGDGTAESPREIIAAGHLPVVGWREGCPAAEGDELPGEDPDEYDDAVGPGTPCRAASQFGTVCAETGVHWRHDDHHGTRWETM